MGHLLFEIYLTSSIHQWHWLLHHVLIRKYGDLSVCGFSEAEIPH